MLKNLFDGSEIPLTLLGLHPPSEFSRGFHIFLDKGSLLNYVNPPTAPKK